MGREEELAIEVAALTMRFGATPAVDRLDLAVPRGSVYGFLGPNGAGKTTTIRILATLLRPDSGRAWVLGHDVIRDPEAVRSRVGLTGQFASVDDDLTAVENLVLLARLLGASKGRANERAQELLAGFGLEDAAGRLVKNLSGGMRRRLDIAASLVVTPDVLFLDEPTTGLDPRSRNQVWDMVRTLADEGTTILLTTQYLDEADRLADRIAVVDHGKVIAEGTSAELKASIGSGSLRVRVRDAERRSDAEAFLTSALDTTVVLDTDPGVLSGAVSEPEDAVRALEGLLNREIDVTGFALGQPSLDEVFLALTGRIPPDRSTGEEEAA